MLNDVRKSDASQRVAASTDFFGRTNHACWEQAANDAAAHVESAQTTNVLGIGGTIIATAFDDNAAPGDAADMPGTNAEDTARCASMGLTLRLRGGGDDDFASRFHLETSRLFPVADAAGSTFQNFEQFAGHVQFVVQHSPHYLQYPVTMQDGRSTTVQALYDHMVHAATQPLWSPCG